MIKEGYHNLAVTFCDVCQLPFLSFPALVIKKVGQAQVIMQPLIAERVLHAGSFGYGALATAEGVGGMLGACWLLRKKQVPTVRSMLLWTVPGCGFGVLYGASHWLWASALLLALACFAMQVYQDIASTLVDTHTNERFLGRVNGLVQCAGMCAMVLGSLFVIRLMPNVGIAATVMIGYGSGLLITIIGWILHTSRQRKDAIVST